QLLLRKVRLKAMRSRMKEQRAELRREFARLDMERAEFQIERARFARKCERMASAGGTRETDRRAADEPIDRWVRTPGHSATEPAADFRPLRSERLAAAALEPDEHAETRESVSEYIDRLLSRVRDRNEETNSPANAITQQPSQRKEAAAASDFV